MKFPRHQAEIMQSEPVFGRPLADIWMHNGSVLSDGQKMSKSLGNFVTWQDALFQAEALAPKLGADLLRMTLLQAHWQKPLDWSSKMLESVRDDLVRLSMGLDNVTPASGEAFLSQLYANLNTPQAFVWLRQQHKLRNLAEVAAGLKFLGLNIKGWSTFKAPVSASTPLSEQEIFTLKTERDHARANKDWARADEIRKILIGHGVDVKDSK